MALKWGFACAGKISFDYINAMGTLPEGHHEVVAVAEPMLTHQADELCKLYNIPKCYTTFLELAKDPSVEIVHVGTLNPYHYEVSMLMLQHGKHVLCQKPMCMNEKQARKLTEYAKQKKLFLTEGLWSRSNPSYKYIREQIQSGALGDIQSVDITFSNYSMRKIDRATKKALGGGTILDLGVYTIQFCQWIFQKEPISIEATGKVNDDGVDMDVNAELNYGNNKIARMRTSFLENLDNTARIVGTRGTMTVPDFWTPTSITFDDGKEWKFTETGKAKHEFIYLNSIGLRYEPEEIRKAIRAEKLEMQQITHSDSLTIARIQDEIRRQLGVKFPADDE